MGKWSRSHIAMLVGSENRIMLIWCHLNRLSLFLSSACMFIWNRIFLFWINYWYMNKQYSFAKIIFWDSNNFNDWLNCQKIFRRATLSWCLSLNSNQFSLYRIVNHLIGISIRCRYAELKCCGHILPISANVWTSYFFVHR